MSNSHAPRWRTSSAARSLLWKATLSRITTSPFSSSGASCVATYVSKQALFIRTAAAQSALLNEKAGELPRRLHRCYQEVFNEWDAEGNKIAAANGQAVPPPAMLGQAFRGEWDRLLENVRESKRPLAAPPLREDDHAEVRSAKLIFALHEAIDPNILLDITPLCRADASGADEAEPASGITVAV